MLKKKYLCCHMISFHAEKIGLSHKIAEFSFKTPRTPQKFHLQRPQNFAKNQRLKGWLLSFTAASSFHYLLFHKYFHAAQKISSERKETLGLSQHKKKLCKKFHAAGNKMISTLLSKRFSLHAAASDIKT